MKKHIIVLSAVLALAGSALAATTSSTEASLSVLPDCSISATDIDMGIYNSRTGASGTGTVRVKCNTEFFVSYSGFTGNLQGSSDQIPYTLTDAAYFQPTIGPKPIDQLDSAPIAARWFDYGFLRPPNNQLADIPTPVNGFIHNLTAVAAPGLWKPAGAYSEILTFDMVFPLNACTTYGLDC
jgi:hypothetical protein